MLNKEVVITAAAEVKLAVIRPPVEIPGIRAQYVQVPPKAEFDYTWRGSSHYLALHDLRLRDGETFSDDHQPSRARDLRGTLTFTPAHCRVWGWSKFAARTNAFTALYFDPRGMEEEVAGRFAVASFAPRLYFSDPALRATLGTLQEELRAATPADNLYLETLCLLSALEVCRFHAPAALSQSSVRGALTPARQKRIVDFIDTNLVRDVSLTDLANTVGLSRYHLVRAFKASTGETPYQYLLRQRIERAKTLLRQSDLTVAEVAAAVGFRSASRFIRAFRRVSGTTPGAFR